MHQVRLAVVTAALALGGCFDVDYTVLGPDQIRLSGYSQMDRSIYDMIGDTGSHCPEGQGTLELSEQFARCNLLMQGTFAGVMDAMQGDGDGPVSAATDLGDGTVRVVVALVTGELGTMLRAAVEDPSNAEAVLQMIEGRRITNSISGTQIVSTNGTVSADGTRATISYALTDLLEAEAGIPETFEAVVRY